MNTHATTWSEVSKLLREARDLAVSPGQGQICESIPIGRLAGTLEEFEEFLQHNELELAWNALAEVADRSAAPSAFWHKMAEAARRMHLPTKTEEAERRASQ